MPRFDRNNPSSLFRHLMATMHRGDDPHGSEMTTIYFRMVDRPSQGGQVGRRDSLIESLTHIRERTRSQAADLVSV